MHCRNSDVQQGFGPRTFLLCACCQDRGSHVDCEEKATGTALITARHEQHSSTLVYAFAGSKISSDAIEAGTDWFCGQVCPCHLQL